MKQRTITRFGLRLAVALCLVGAFYGCGGDEPEAPATTGGPETGERPAASPAETPRISPTAQLLQYAPADPMLVVVLPSVQSLERHVIDFSTRIAPPDADIQGTVAAWSAELAQSLELDPAATPVQMLAGLGIDPSAPMAIYVDTDAFSERYMAEVKRIKAEMDTAAVESGDAMSEDAGTDEMASPGSTDDAGADVTMERGDVDMNAAPDMDLDMGEDDFAFETPPTVINPFEVAGLPAIAAAFAVHDAAKAVAQLDAALQKSPAAASFMKEEREASGVTITVYDPKYCAYFVSDGYLFVSNDLAWLEQVAARVASPAPMAEGVVDGSVDDEQLIAAIRMDQMAPLVEAMTLANTLMPGQAGMMAEMQIGSWDEMKAVYSGTDPAVVTLSWNDTRIAFDTRMNMDKHPAMMEMAGPASAMRLASVLPATTQAMLSFRLSPELKASIRKYWIDAVPSEALQDPSVAGAMMGANQALEMIDDEIAVGLTGMANNIPSGLIMIGLTDPQAVIQQLGMFIMMAGAGMPEMPEEPGAIQELSVAGTMTFYYTVLNNALMVATVRAELEEAVENLKAASASDYFASLDPSMDPKQPRYFALSLKPAIVQEIIAMQGESAGMDPAMQKALGVVKELRMTQDMVGPMLIQHMGLYLNAP